MTTGDDQHVWRLAEALQRQRTEALAQLLAMGLDTEQGRKVMRLSRGRRGVPRGTDGWRI